MPAIAVPMTVPCSACHGSGGLPIVNLCPSCLSLCPASIAGDITRALCAGLNQPAAVALFNRAHRAAVRAAVAAYAKAHAARPRGRA